MRHANTSRPLVNGRFLTRRLTGVDRFAVELLGVMAPLLPELEAIVPAAASVVAAPIPGLPVRHGGRFDGHAWEQVALPRIAGDRLLLNLCNTAPALRERQAVVVHDAGAIANASNYSPAFRAWYRVMLTGVMRRSRLVATVSRFSADELMRHFGRDAARGIELVGEGGEHILREAADDAVIDRLDLRGRRFVLAVGSQSANKNFSAVLAAMDSLQGHDVLLVAAGGGDPKVFAASDVQHPRLRRAGYVSDRELRALYEHALCFAFPSFYEGFGLPPVEAMCCGCPVIVSQRASLPEVCGTAALYCDPTDAATLAAQIQRVIDSDSLREELSAAGRARAAQWTWARAGSQFMDLLRQRFPDALAAQTPSGARSAFSAAEGQVP
jgi:glycosyltransferase involved in cell wall biosynthesis